MPKLELRFENAPLAEYALGTARLTIGRGPDCDIQIDNLAVSTHHAFITVEKGQYAVEDNKSLNGTLVNNAKIDRCLLRDGDRIAIGKHTLVFYQYAEAAKPLPGPVAKVPTPALNQTFVLETKKRVEMLRDPAEARAVSARVPIATLHVLQGKTDQAEYILTSELTIIGKSNMATVKLRGWFRPQTAGIIMRKRDGYHVGPASATPKVRLNGQPVVSPQLIRDGDVIDVPGAKLLFRLPQ
jgi:pSer/pThr/pTyr-binding forkhead associated (FHA) protein